MQFFKQSFRENRLAYLKKAPETPPAISDKPKSKEKISKTTKKEQLKLLGEVLTTNNEFLTEFKEKILDDEQKIVIARMTKKGNSLEEIIPGEDDLKAISSSLHEIDNFFDKDKKEKLERDYNAVQAIKIAIKAKKQAAELFPENDQMTDEKREEALENQKKYIKTVAAIYIMDVISLTQEETTKFIEDYKIVEEALYNEGKYLAVTEVETELKLNLVNMNFFTSAFFLLGNRRLQMKTLEKLKNDNKAAEEQNIKKALYFLSLQKIVDEDFMREVLIHADYFDYSGTKADRIIKEIQTRISKEEAEIDEKKGESRVITPRIEKLKNGIIKAWKDKAEKAGKGIKKGKEKLEELGFPKEDRIRWIKYKQPEKYSTNKFVQFFTLKNIFLLEFVGRITLYTALLNIAVDLDTLIKDPSVGLKNMLKNPYIWGGFGASAAIMETVAPPEYKLSKLIGFDKYSLMISGFSVDIFDKEITKSDSDEILILGLLANKPTFNFIRDKFSSLTIEEKEEALGGNIKDFFGEFYEKIPPQFKQHLDTINEKNPEKVLNAFGNAYVFMRKHGLVRHKHFYEVQQDYIGQYLYK